MNTKEEVINHLIAQGDYKSYLEIGTQLGESIKRVGIETRHGVDPVNALRNQAYCNEFFKMTSDDFFHGKTKGLDEYDICFVDGLHHAEQTLADIANCIARLSKGGAVVVHDLLPANEIEQEVPRRSNAWTGDCWKAWYLLLQGNYNMTLTTYHFDHGVGTITDIKDEALDDLLCDFSSLINDIELVTYEEHFDHYLELLK